MVELISIHIGKTAGTAFRSVLSQVYQEQNVLWDYPPYPYKPPAPLPDNIRAIHGHIPAKKYQGYFPDAKWVVWLRHPLFRLISEYYFARLYKDKGNHLHRALIEEDLGFSEFAEQPAARNIMSGYISGLSFKDFYFIGLQEFYELDLADLETLMGWTHQSAPIRNANPEPKYQHYVSKILANVDLVQKIADLNAEDMLLYQEALKLRATRTGSSILLQETMAAWNRSAIMLRQARTEKQTLDIQRQQLAWQLKNLGHGSKEVDVVSSNMGSLKDHLQGFYIDSPREPTIVKEFIEISGWVLGKQLNVKTVQLVYDKSLVCEVPVNGYRPDVAQVYHSDKASMSGFSLTLLISGIKDESIFKLKAKLENDEIVEIGHIRINSI